MHKNLSSFIEELESQNELMRITEFVSPILEMTEINDRIIKNNGKALLFEQTGKGFPVLLNAFGSEKRLCMALGVKSLDEVGDTLELLFKKFSSPKKNLWSKLKLLPELASLASYMPKTLSGKGACQEIICHNPNLFDLPILQCWPYDGGQFITLPIVHTQDPHTGARNVGMYRIQAFEPQLAALHWHLHKNSARHYREYKKLGKRMPVSVALGGNPVYTYAATAPLPDQIDEYILAGFLSKKKVNLVKCITNDLEVPADADIIIEGYVDPNEELIWEGPFGDHTGFYSLADYYPRFHITCITHKKNAVYPATIVGIPPQEDKFFGIATERIFLSPIKMAMQQDILDIKIPVEGGFHNVVIVKIKKEYAGQGLKVINSLWGMGGMMFSKFIIAIDETTDINNFESILKAIEENVCLHSDLIFSKGPLDVLDHSSNQFAFGSKLGIDATQKQQEEILFRKKTSPIQTNENNSSTELPAFIKETKNIGNQIMIIALEETAKNWNLLTEKAKDMFPNKKYIIAVDYGLEISLLSDILWYVAANVDPQRDIVLSDTQWVINACRKHKGENSFNRDWPNPVIMDDETIEKIDAQWHNLGFKEFLASPSLQYKKLNRGYSAIAEEK